MSVTDIPKAPDQEKVDAFAVDLMHRINADIDAGKINHHEALLACIHTACIILSKNADPDQRARFCQSFVMSFPELVRRYAAGEHLKSQTPPERKH